MYREVIIHETAHQWWYAVVGNNQVDDAWLDEALAEYSTTLFYEKMPDYEVSYTSRLASAMSTYGFYCEQNGDKSFFSTKMQRPLSEFYNGSEYTCMTYVKGQIMYDVLRAHIGQKKFNDALKTYYKENSFKIATPELLTAAFESASGRELAPFFSSWADGKTLIYIT
jgi:aminopeptidase N